MKIQIDIDPTVTDLEVTLKCAQIDETVAAVQKALTAISADTGKMAFRQGETEYFFSVKKVLFFETDEGKIRAHTATDEFTVDYKLYELEELLPSYFMRVSKSTILNVRQVYGITRNLTASSKVEFQNSHKIVYVSRNYYKALLYNLKTERQKN